MLHFRYLMEAYTKERCELNITRYSCECMGVGMGMSMGVGMGMS